MTGLRHSSEIPNIFGIPVDEVDEHVEVV